MKTSVIRSSKKFSSFSKENLIRSDLVANNSWVCQLRQATLVVTTQHSNLESQVPVSLRGMQPLNSQSLVTIPTVVAVAVATSQVIHNTRSLAGLKMIALVTLMLSLSKASASSINSTSRTSVKRTKLSKLLRRARMLRTRRSMRSRNWRMRSSKVTMIDRQSCRGLAHSSSILITISTSKSSLQNRSLRIWTISRTFVKRQVVTETVPISH